MHQANADFVRLGRGALLGNSAELDGRIDGLESSDQLRQFLAHTARCAGAAPGAPAPGAGVGGASRASIARKAAP
jgi:hypothetical protein